MHSLMPRGPWAVDETHLRRLPGDLGARWAALQASPVAVSERVALEGRRAIGQQSGAVGIIPIRGLIERELTVLGWLFGGTSVVSIAQARRTFEADATVATIVYDYDSPGGSVSGLVEEFEAQFTARAIKPSISVCSGLMASAAYWLACGAEQVVMTPSSESGSVGVYMLHEDYSRALDAEGVTPTFIQYGAHKTDGNPYEPLSDEARTSLQASVDFFGQQFVRSVSKGRNKSVSEVRATFGEGRLLRAPQALQVGMVDRVVSGVTEVISRMAGRRARGIDASTWAEFPNDRAVLQRELDLQDVSDGRRARAAHDRRLTAAFEVHAKANARALQALEDQERRERRR